MRISNDNPIEFLVMPPFPNQCVSTFDRFAVSDLIDLAVSPTVPCEIAHIGRICENLSDDAACPAGAAFV